MGTEAELSAMECRDSGPDAPATVAPSFLVWLNLDLCGYVNV